MRTLAADVILLIHFAIVLFIVGGLALIWVGHVAHWRWVRGMAFRVSHLATIVVVAAEAALGIACPLTVWEDALRGTADEKNFVARWVHQLMFYSAPEWVFTALYAGFALLVAMTFWLVPPERNKPSK